MSLHLNDSFSIKNNRPVFKESGELKDDGLNEAVARARAPKRRYKNDKKENARRVKADVNQKIFQKTIVHQTTVIPANPKRPLNEDVDWEIKRIKMAGEMDASKLSSPSYKRHLNEDQDHDIKKVKTAGEIDATKVAPPIDKRHFNDDNNPKVKRQKECVDELVELFDKRIRLDDESYIKTIEENIKHLVNFIKVTEQGVEKIDEGVVFIGGNSEKDCGDLLLAACKNGDIVNANEFFDKAKYLVSFTRTDESGTNAYFYAKQNGMNDMALLIQKRVLSIFYEASIKNDQELARVIWNLLSNFDIEREEDRLFDTLDPGLQFGILADMRIKRIIALLRENQQY